jgi:hypothetical protein
MAKNKNKNKKAKNNRRRGSGGASKLMHPQNALAMPIPASKLSDPQYNDFCAYLDPFCDELGKVPDGMGLATIPFHLKRIYQVGVDANGYGAQAFAVGRLTSYRYAPNGFTAGAVTSWTANNHEDEAALAAFGSAFRVVSAGFRVTCIANATAVQGWKSCKVNKLTGTGVDTTFSKISDPATALENAAVSEPCVIQVFPNSIVSEQFISFSSTTADWPVYALFVSGAAASTIPVMIEEFLKIEVQIDATNILTRGTTHAHPRNELLLQARSQIPDAGRGARFMRSVREAENTVKEVSRRVGKIAQIGAAAVRTYGALGGGASAGASTALAALPYLAAL